MDKTKDLGKRILIYTVLISLLWPSITPLASGFVTWAEAAQQTNMTIQQEILKYIPYAENETEQGVVLQAEVKAEAKDLQESSKWEMIIANPSYAGIAPTKVTIFQDQKEMSQDSKQDSYYTVDEKTNTSLIQQKLNGQQSISQTYVVTWKYPKEAYEKYLQTTHVNDYEDGTITKIEKDEQTGETWVYVDFAWDGQGEKPANKVKMDPISIALNVQWGITQKGGTITQEDAVQKQMDVSISDFVKDQMNYQPNEMSKGKLYSKQEIHYQVEHTINVTKHDLIHNMTLEDNTQNWIKETGDSLTAGSLYESTSVDKQSFDQILGENGKIQITDQNDQEIACITKDTNMDAQGNYQITYPDATEIIKMKMSEIQKDGFLKIVNQKKLKQEDSYTTSDKQAFTQLKTIATVQYTDANNKANFVHESANMEWLDTKTTAHMSLSTNTLSADEINQNVECKIELNNNQEMSDLWSNPQFFVEFPVEVEKVVLNKADVLYGDDLKLAQTDILDKDGKKVIRVMLSGKQKNYLADQMTGGTTLILNMNLKLKELTPTKSNNEVTLYYYNESYTHYENEMDLPYQTEYKVGSEKKTFNYVTQIAFKTIQTISNFDDNGTVLNSNEGAGNGKISILSPERVAQNQITVMNNTGNTNTNIKIMGRVAWKGNQSILTGEDLQSTFSIPLFSIIKMTGDSAKTYQVYYSNNGTADSDLSKMENGWTTKPENMSQVKSFLITMDQMDQGEVCQFVYSTHIPAMLEHEETAYEDVVTTYENNTGAGKVTDVSRANRLGLTTGIGARMNIQLDADIPQGEKVTEGQKITYQITLRNTGGQTAKNVVVKNKIPNGTSYVQETKVENELETYHKYTYYSSSNEMEWQLGDIGPNETKVLNYTVVVDPIPSILEYYGGQEGFTEEDGHYYIVKKDPKTGEMQKTEITDIPTIIIQNSARLTADNMDKELVSNENKHEVNKSYFSLSEESSQAKSLPLEEGESYTYTIIVENKRDLTCKNLTVTKTLPEGVTYEEAKVLEGEGQVQYDAQTRTVTITRGEFQGNSAIEIQIQVKADTISADTPSKKIKSNSKIWADGIPANTTNMVTNTITKAKVTASIEADVKQKYVYPGDYITYTISVKNENPGNISNLNIQNTIPDGTKFISGSYRKNGYDYLILGNGSQDYSVQTNLGQEEIVLTIKVQVETPSSQEKEINLEDVAKMQGKYFPETQIGKVKHTILNENTTPDDPSKPTDPNDPSKPNQGGKGEKGEDGVIRYCIQGVAWEDTNQDGQRQEDEKMLSGIQVYLLKEDGTIAKDYQTGENKTATTDKEGNYLFRNVEVGKYMVVFVYDEKEYAITQYQVSGVSNDRNSDAIEKEITMQSKKINAGVTDFISVQDRGMYSIDIGLYKNPKFNLGLQAGITNITVTTKSGTTKQSYSNSVLAKKEIRSKEIKGAEVVVEYSLTITNNSDVAGSVSEMTAQIPEGFTFASDYNQQWYEGKDKKLYCIALADQMIQPGQSQTLTLNLVKKMNDSNTGQFDAQFKISKTFNAKGLEEQNTEDNTVKVTGLLSVATGQVPLYVGGAIALLLFIAGGIYTIRFLKTRPKKEKRWK